LEIVFTPRAIKERDYWRKSGNKTVQNRISLLMQDIFKTPFSGIRKPEPLRENLSGYWSRRITHEHRLVYKVDILNDLLIVVSIRFHY
jgi:toxin YoeB